MGARLAVAALGFPGKLTDRARLTLVGMALLALDSPSKRHEACVYFGGRDHLLARMGVMPTSASRRWVDRNTAELVAAGAVERIRGAGRGNYARYRLALPAHVEPVDNAARTKPSGHG